MIQGLKGMGKHIILDKNFLQAEAKGGPRLKALTNNGCVLVITDTLVYELYTGSGPSDWKHAKEKLAPVLDHLQVWRHSSESLSYEVENQKPLAHPYDHKLTIGIRELIRSGSERSGPSFDAFVREETSRREVDSPNALFKFCKVFSQLAPSYFKALRRLSSKRQNVSPIVNEALGDDELMKKAVLWSHGDPDCSETFISESKSGLSPEWFAYHHAKMKISVAIIYSLKYLSLESPSMDFINTVLDADYAMHLHYADALATNETKGGMSQLAIWMNGEDKLVFSTQDLDACLPSESEIRIAADEVWEKNGRSHGHDLHDWFMAEQSCLAELWQNLQNHTAGKE